MSAIYDSSASYFVLDSGDPDMTLFYSLVNPSPRDRWWAGKKFAKEPPLPVKAVIRPENEDGKILAYHNPVNLMSDALAKVILASGVDNLDLYNAVIVDEKGKVYREDYKAFNLIGIIRAADLQQTEFMPGSDSRLIDASIAKLAIDERKAHGALMFRLAENVSAVLVHARVARAIAEAKLDGVLLREVGEIVKP